MSTSIKHLRSAEPGKIPTTGQLELGELAINTYDGNLFIKRRRGILEDIVKFVSSNPVENVIYVQKNGSDANTVTGTSWDDAFLTIERAVEAANERDGEITVIDIGPGEKQDMKRGTC
jgi:hypothetical protein